MALHAERFEGRPEEWDALVDASNEGTIFHKLGFLEYHGERFRGCTFPVALRKGETLVGVLPMAILEQDGRRLGKSPFGASYGGLAVPNPLTYSESGEALRAILDLLGQAGVDLFQVVLPIAACYRTFSDTFRFAMLEHGFTCTSREISSVVPLNRTVTVEDTVTSRARNMSRKAEKLGVTCRHRAPLQDVLGLLDLTFDRHGTAPTHSHAELKWLSERFPEEIYADVAYVDGVPAAGVVCFVANARVNSSFYLCQDRRFQATQAQSFAVLHSLRRSYEAGYQGFDFGTSTAGMEARPNLFRFKEAFGAVGQFRETYCWRRSPAEPKVAAP